MSPTPDSRSNADDSPPDDEDEAISLGEAMPGTADAGPATGGGEALEKIRMRLQRLDETLDRLRSVEARREQRFDRLHAELEQYRNRHYERLQEPVLRALIQHDDTLAKLCTTRERHAIDTGRPDDLLDILRGLRDDVEVLLEQQGVDRFVSPADGFDGSRQTVARTVPTDDTARAGTVAARLRPGFEIGDRLLAKERVAVFVPRTSAPSTEDSESPRRASRTEAGEGVVSDE